MHLFRRFLLRILTLALGVGLLGPVPLSARTAPPAPAAGSQSRTTGAQSSAKKPSTTRKKRPAKRRYSAKNARARRAALARARAQARLRELREAQTPRFRTDENGNLVPDIRAAAAIVVNPETGQVLFETNEFSFVD